MRRLPAVVLACAALGLTSCSSAPDPQPVTVLAGGGSEALDTRRGTAADGADIALDGVVTGLTGRGDGAVWGLLGRTFVLGLEADGTVRARPAATEAGDLVELVDVAAAPDGTVYVLPSDVGELELGTDAAVYQLDDDNVIRPAVGEDGEFGPVTAIDVDPDGRPLFLENVGDTDAAASDYQPHQLRRVEADGSVTTLAGASTASDEGPESADYQTWLSLPDGEQATDVPLYRHTSLAVGSDGAVYLGSSSSIAVVGDDGQLQHVAGGGSDDESGDGPIVPLDAAFGDSVPADELAGTAFTGPLHANGAGAVISSFLVDTDAHSADEVVSWDAEGGNEAVDGIVEDAWTGSPTLLVSASGEVTLATALGQSAAWLDDDTLVVAASGEDGASIVVAIDTP